MSLVESIMSGLMSIWTHKLRSALTLFGIVVGVAAVVAMTSFVGGISDRVMEDFDQLGFDNVLFIANMRPYNPDNLARLKTSKGLTFEDTQVLRREVPGILYLCPTIDRRLVARYGSEARHAEVFGATPDGFPLLKMELGTGRLFTWTDVDNHARICVLGELIREKLFGEANPLGESVLLGSQRFEVVGVLQHLRGVLAAAFQLHLLEVAVRRLAQAPLARLGRAVVERPAPVGPVLGVAGGRDEQQQGSDGGILHGRLPFRG